MVSGAPILFGERRCDSPFVFTAFVALAEKRVSFEFKVVDLAAGEQRTPEFASRSLTERVPTLEDASFCVSESLAIVEYLEERWPTPEYPPVLPASIQGRARARQVLGWLRTDLAALRRARPSDSIFYTRVTTPLDAAAQKDADKLVRVASALLGNRATIADDWCIADADLAFALMRLHVNGDTLEPALARYAEAQWQRPCVARWAELERP
jgi:glutathione S-transferase